MPLSAQEICDYILRSCRSSSLSRHRQLIGRHTFDAAEEGDTGMIRFASPVLVPHPGRPESQ